MPTVNKECDHFKDWLNINIVIEVESGIIEQLHKKAYLEYMQISLNHISFHYIRVGY